MDAASTDIITALQGILSNELAAIQLNLAYQLRAHVAGFKKLEKFWGEITDDERDHQRRITKRILYLQGTPNMLAMDAVKDTPDVQIQIENAIAAETTANELYNKAVNLCAAAGDNVTSEILRRDLEEEDHHLRHLEKARDQIAAMTLPVWLNAMK
jgi:bacterioferritin